MIRKNKKFIDPRYFMDEKMEEIQSRDPGGVGGMYTDSTPTKTGLKPEEIQSAMSTLEGKLGDVNWILNPNLVGDTIITDGLMKLAQRSMSTEQYLGKIEDYLLNTDILDRIYDGLKDEVAAAYADPDPDY